MSYRVALIPGDGIGPEIMTAVLRILEAARAHLDIGVIEIGESVYRRGFGTGIEPSSWESLRRTRVFLKAPITTPQGGGFKSLKGWLAKRRRAFTPEAKAFGIRTAMGGAQARRLCPGAIVVPYFDFFPYSGSRNSGLRPWHMCSWRRMGSCSTG